MKNIILYESFVENKKNIKKVKITIPNDVILKKIITTPALNKLSRIKLLVGDNIEHVNHYQFSELMRMFPIVGASVEEIKE